MRAAAQNSTFYGTRWHLLATFSCQWAQMLTATRGLLFPPGLRRRLLEACQPTAETPLSDCEEGSSPAKQLIFAAAPAPPSSSPKLNQHCPCFWGFFLLPPQLFCYCREQLLLNRLTSCLDADIRKRKIHTATEYFVSLPAWCLYRGNGGRRYIGLAWSCEGSSIAVAHSLLTALRRCD